MNDVEIKAVSITSIECYQGGYNGVTAVLVLFDDGDVRVQCPAESDCGYDECPYEVSG